MLLPLLLACALLRAATCAPQLLLVSCDGFRYDYLDWYPEETRFLRGLIPRGVHVERMTPAFATKTFPNHWTIATGLYQENHGIISNSMYDPEFDAWFNKGTREERWWNASLPVWISAVKQGLTAATFFWPGSEIEFGGVRQNYYYEYDGSIPYEQRVKEVLHWITEKRINLTVMYLDEPDAAGHKFGPWSEEVRLALSKVDQTLRSLFDGLAKRNFLHKVNVVIVSDHGMTETSPDKIYNLTNTIDKYVDKYLDSGPLFGVNPKPGRRMELLRYLNSLDLPGRVVPKELLPASLHYSAHRRIPEILVLPLSGYAVVSSHDKPVRKGVHGYSNEYGDMKVPMFAVGPSFKTNVRIGGFRQVDIYGLLCHLLGIVPKPNDGSTALFPWMLKTAP